MIIQERLLKIIRDDNYAAGFQSLGQYRTALLQAARGEVEDAPVDVAALAARLSKVIRDLESGFVACERCGDQEDTATLDCMPELTAIRNALASHRKQGGWTVERASPVDLRKELSAAQTLASAGILFVPIPVLNEDDHAALRAEVIKRMEQIIETTEHQEPSNDNQ